MKINSCLQNTSSSEKANRLHKRNWTVTRDKFLNSAQSCTDKAVQTTWECCTKPSADSCIGSVPPYWLEALSFWVVCPSISFTLTQWQTDSILVVKRSRSLWTRMTTMSFNISGYLDRISSDLTQIPLDPRMNWLDFCSLRSRIMWHNSHPYLLNTSHMNNYRELILIWLKCPSKVQS